MADNDNDKSTTAKRDDRRTEDAPRTASQINDDNTVDKTTRVAADGTEYEVHGVNDTKCYYLVSKGEGNLPERVDCEELPASTPKGGYATAEEINAYQADDDTDKSGVDLTPSVFPRNAVS
jgi:hypothetical protein